MREAGPEAAARQLWPHVPNRNAALHRARRLAGGSLPAWTLRLLLQIHSARGRSGRGAAYEHGLRHHGDADQAARRRRLREALRDRGAQSRRRQPADCPCRGPPAGRAPAPAHQLDPARLQAPDRQGALRRARDAGTGGDRLRPHRRAGARGGREALHAPGLLLRVVQPQRGGSDQLPQRARVSRRDVRDDGAGGRVAPLRRPCEHSWRGPGRGA